MARAGSCAITFNHKYKAYKANWKWNKAINSIPFSKPAPPHTNSFHNFPKQHRLLETKHSAAEPVGDISHSKSGREALLSYGQYT